HAHRSPSFPRNELPPRWRRRERWRSCGGLELLLPPLAIPVPTSEPVRGLRPEDRGSGPGAAESAEGPSASLRARTALARVIAAYSPSSYGECRPGRRAGSRPAAPAEGGEDLEPAKNILLTPG